MRILLTTIALVAVALMVTGCDKSTPPVTTTAPAATTAPSTTQRIKQDLKAAGENLKDAGKAVAEKVEPSLHEAKEESKALVHKAAQKVSDFTAPSTAPATVPGTQP